MRKSTIGGIEPETKDRYDVAKICCKVGGKRHTAESFMTYLLDLYEKIHEDEEMSELLFLHRINRNNPRFRDALKELINSFTPSAFREAGEEQEEQEDAHQQD